MIEANTNKRRNENASFFRNKGGRHSHRLLQENIALKKEIEQKSNDYSRLKKDYESIVKKHISISTYSQIQEQDQENQHKEIESLKAKIVEQEKKISEQQHRIVKYEDKEKKLMESKLSKLIKPLIHTGMLITSNINQLQKSSTDKKYSEDDVKLLLYSQEEKLLGYNERLESDLENAETEIEAQYDELRLSNKEIDRLRRENQRLITDQKSRVNDLEVKIVEQQQKILSYQDQYKKKIQRKGYQVPATIIDALNSVEDKHANIIVTKDAKKGSKKCKFESPEQVLDIIDIVAGRHAKWIKSGKNGILDLEKDMGVGGKKIDVSNSDSTPWKGRYNGEEYIVKKHIRIGTNYDQKRCLRIYFEYIDDKIVIFYCNRHP